MRPKVLSRVLVVFSLLTLLGPASYGFYRWEQGNFDAVSQHTVYRSRQLTGAELIDVVQRHGIKSVLNLRGRNDGGQWYRDEVTVAHRLQLHHYDYPISAHLELNDRQTEGLLEILRDAPKPLLIHCRSGADRTALAAAMYLHTVEHQSPEEASRQLSVYYGHLPPALGTESSAMDRTFWHYVERSGKRRVVEVPPPQTAPVVVR